MKQETEVSQNQETFIRAVDQYIERHTLYKGSGTVPDMETLGSINLQAMIREFGTSIEKGLTTEQAAQNQKTYGSNVYKKRKVKNLCVIFKEAICDPMLIVLMIAAVVSIVVEYFFGEEKDKFWVEGTSILIAVFVVTLVSTITNYKKQQQFDELDKLAEAAYNFQVLRNGERTTIQRDDLVVGDMIFVTNGIEVPTDSYVIKAVDIIINESSITGESQEVYKNTYEQCEPMKTEVGGPTPIMVSGSTIISGEGLMLSVVVGRKSKIGQNYELLFSGDEEQSKTPLEKKLAHLGKSIGKFGIFASIFIFIVLFVRLVVQQNMKGGFHANQQAGKIVTYLIMSVTVIVVAIPEGLPLAVTLTLAFSMKQMYKDKILVRKLASCETMGAAHYICTDKTGTLTQNKMTVVKVLNTAGIVDFGDFTKKVNKDYSLRLTNCIFNNTSAFVEEQKGAQTQLAQLKAARVLSGKDQVAVREETKKNSGGVYFKRIPFNSTRKRLTTGATFEGKDFIISSGASERILAACQSIQDAYTNQITKLTDNQMNTIKRQLDQLAGFGLRTVGVAYKQVSKQQVSKTKAIHGEDIEPVQKDGFILLGIFGIEDLPRPESKPAIESSKRAGIKVIMITGDNKKTAGKIAKEVGIIDEGHDKVIEGNEFFSFLENNNLLKQSVDEKDPTEKGVRKVALDSDEQIQKFKEISDGLAVMARSKPEHKYLLVDGLNKLGNVVAVTGDGANDAPALKRADIGLAMGITGTQVAKNAADIVILDDKFDSIVRAIVWGRNVYVSIRRFLQFQMTVNLVAVSLVLISSALIEQPVLTAIQMLWVNLIMDSLAALALATEPPKDEELLNQKPYALDEPLITKTMLKHIIGQGIFQITVLIVLLFLGFKFIPEQRDAFDDIIGKDLEAKYYRGIPEGTIADGRFYTIKGEPNYKIWFDKYKVYTRLFTFIFNTFVFMQVFNFFCCRRIKDEKNICDRIFSTWIFWAIIIIVSVLQAVIIEFLGDFFQIYKYGGLTPIQWLISIALASLTIVVRYLLILIKTEPDPNAPVENE